MTGPPAGARAARLLLGAALLLPAVPRAGEAPPSVVAVLSSDAAPYLEAFSAFRKALGREVPLIIVAEDAAPRLPADARVVVAFGGKAARAAYPGGARLIYALAPGTAVSRGGAPALGISLIPEPGLLAARMKALQPRLKRLGILWASPSFADAVPPLTAAFSRAGVEVQAERLEDAAQIPRALRRLLGRVDALWIPPDPALISEEALLAVKEFSWANDVPFYAPTEGLVESGAVAAVSVSYAGVGRAAAAAALGESREGTLYPAAAEVAVNPRAAAESGLALPPAEIRRANRVVEP